jgi:phospholipid N-methyltransferase
MKRLKKEFTDPRVILIHDSAEKIGEYLSKYDLSSTDAVISSLPLANFPTALKSKILKESFDRLNENGTYVQFQYSLNAKNLIKSQFPKVKIAFTPLNFPPAFVYTCRKTK